MGQRVTLMCDLHNNNTEAVESLRFAVGTHTYEIDLCDKHLKEFHDKVASFVDGARAVGTSRSSSGKKAAPASRRASRSRKAAGPTVDLTVVRDWARENGWEVSNRGRLPGAIMEAYQEAAEG